MLNNFVKFLNDKNYQERELLKILNSFSRKIKVLDVGCGYGRNIKLLNKNKFNNIVGIEVNEEILKKNRKNGLLCYTPDDFLNNFKREEFDVILMSHIIEHFSYNDLKFFLDKYLEFLKKDGRLIIVTPLMTKFFYKDFDHVKPYDPLGLSKFFSHDSQLQFYSKYQMKLENLYFRKSPYKLKNFRSLYIKKNSISIVNKIPGFINIILAIFFRLTGGAIGYISGWIGEFKRD